MSLPKISLKMRSIYIRRCIVYMGKFVVTGGKRLKGRLRVPGAKNTVLPILAATIISGKKTILTDCPVISDVENTLEILKDMGCKVKNSGSVIEIDSSDIIKTTINEKLMEKMRSSIILTGAIIARKKKADTSFPGGCELGLRPIDLHIKAFKELSISVNEQYGFIHFDGENMKNADIHLSFPSVGATENIMLVAMGIPGTTRIINAAKEPEIEDLQIFLNKMGGKIKGAGTGIIEIEGVSEFKDVTHKIIPDRIVTATYIAAAAVTGGEIEIENAELSHLDAVVSVFKEAGVVFENKKDGIISVKAPNKLKSVNIIRTTPYPGFPTDAQSILSSVLSVADGTSIIVENIFEQRFKHIDELLKMGADITVNGSCAVIKGKDKLYGAKTSAPDLRSGAALVIAGLCANGKTEISNSCFVERGYEDLAGNLSLVGADIKFIEG